MTAAEVRSAPTPELPGLRRWLAERFGEAAASAEIEPLGGADGVKGGGYARARLVHWSTPFESRRLVVETANGGGFGHEDRADRLAGLVRAFDDSASLPGHVLPIDVVLPVSDGTVSSLARTGEPFIVWEVAGGRPYAEDFPRIAETGRLNERDEERAWALADYLVELHRAPISHPTWWRRRLRELAGSGECIAGIADSWPTDGFVTADLLEDVERKVLAWRYRLRGSEARLREIHGDFHPWNVLFRDRTELTLFDRSRGRFGDPADDVAAMAINYLFFAIRTRGSFTGPFADLFRIFWSRYLDRSCDRHLGSVIAPHLAFRSLVVASPVWYPNESDETRRLLFRFLLSVLEEPSFDPERIAAYLLRERP